jgi:hypothetical protein
MTGCSVQEEVNKATQCLVSYICQIPTFNFEVSKLPKGFVTERKFLNGLINWKNENFCSFVGRQSCVVVVVLLREIKHGPVRYAS